MMEAQLKSKNLSGQPLPYYATEGASGLDLSAATSAWIEPGAASIIPTGICIELPQGYEAQIRPRSSTVLRYGLLVVLGTIDQDFRDEIGIVVVNLRPGVVMIERGYRLAQMVIAPVTRVKVVEAAVTATGRGGFGSTG
jgi:dUTP pyrophosphatase